jgi:hypothetical protein
MIKRVAYIALISAGLFLSSCKDSPSKNHGPIILGDSSTIVTETDPKNLQDLVTDLHPDIPSHTTDTAETKETAVVADTIKQTKIINPPQQPQQPQLSGNGLLAEFKDVSVLISNVTGKQSGNPNLQRANGAVYTLTGGTINGAQMKLKGNVTKVSQRYQSAVLLKNGYGTLVLDNLSETTDWETMKGSNNQYRISGLDAQSLETADANANTIRNAVSNAAKRQRWSRKKTDEVLNSLRHVRNVNQKPLTVTLRSVMWKIDGKDAQGRAFSKQIRIDIPL